MKLIDQKISIKDLWHKMQLEQGESDLKRTYFDLSSLANKRILITGAAGYLGQYLIQGCLGFKKRPELIVALDHNPLPENSASMGNLNRERIVSTTKESELDFNGIQAQETTKSQAPQIISINGEAGDLELLNELHDKYTFDIIIHAAANKYLPQLEQQPAKALIQNTWTSYRLIEFTKEHKISKFIYISTDKATAPSSIYGLSKLWPERHLSYIAQQQPKPHCSIIRLVNLLGSTGSVLRLWEKEFASTQKITLRSQDLTRYFILPEMAAWGIWQVAVSSQKNKRWAIDSGAPWSIKAMALVWLSLKGVKDLENHLIHTQPLPGEKLSEALWEPTDQPISLGMSGLKYVSVKSSKDWPNSQLNQHQQSIEALKALLENSSENLNPVSHEQARVWFKNCALDI